METHTIIILVLSYLISVIHNYLYFKEAYSKTGIWSYSYASKLDLWVTFVPIFNTIVCIIFLFIHPRKQTIKEKEKLTNFFKPKR